MEEKLIKYFQREHQVIIINTMDSNIDLGSNKFLDVIWKCK